MHRNALGMLCLAMLGAGCTPSERGSAAGATAAHADATRLAAAVPTLRAATSSTPQPTGDGASVQQTTGFHFERVILDPVDQTWMPQRVLIGDVTGDGRADLVGSLDSATRPQVIIRIRAQRDDGSFAVPTDLHVDSVPNSRHTLELADLDGDGLQDIILAHHKGLAVATWVGAKFDVRSHPAPRPFSALAALDANRDGHLDIFAQETEYGATVFYGDGRGGFASSEHLATGYAPYPTAEMSDFTGDGIADLIIGRSAGYFVRIYPVHRETGLRKQSYEFDVRSVQDVTYGDAVGDIDRDGRPDLVISDWGRAGTAMPRGVRVLYRGAGDGFTHSVLLETPGAYTYPSVLRIADLDRNGYPDIVVMYDSSDSFGYMLQGPGGFAPVVVVRTDDAVMTNNHYGENAFAVDDINSDGCPDIALAELSSSLRVFYGRGCSVPTPRMSTRHPPVGP